MKQLSAILFAARPRQWLKNFILFVPIVFGGRLFNADMFLNVVSGAIAFCFLSSSNYILNDVIDVERDRRHPFKKLRPIARRDIPESAALLVAVALLIFGLVIANTLGMTFFLSAWLFVILHWMLYFFFRTRSVIDVLSIASGYVLRLFAGEAAADIHVSIWLFLAVLSFSLLLAIGKRRAELSLIVDQRKRRDNQMDTDVFQYSEKLLDAYVAVFANATFLTYSYYTFLANPGSEGLTSIGLNTAWLDRKWLMVTIPAALYGIMRYLQIVYSTKEGTLEKIVTSDKPLLAALAIWGISVLVVVYGIGG